MAAGAVALALTGIEDAVGGVIDHGLQIFSQEDGWEYKSGMIVQHTAFLQGGTAAVPTNVLIADKVVDYENEKAYSLTVTQARLVSDQGIGTPPPDPLYITFPAANIQGSPVTLEPGQILRFTSIECTIV